MATEVIEVIETQVEVVEVITQGPQGNSGTNGQGVPVGGTTGQVLKKTSSTNYATEWGNQTSIVYGTTAGTACEGNDGRIATIGSGAINTATGVLQVGLGGGSTETLEVYSADRSGLADIKVYSVLFVDDQNTGYTGSLSMVNDLTADRGYYMPNATGTLALTQQATDYEVTDSTKGVIMKSPNGSRWRVTIGNDGVLLRTALALILSAFMMCGAKAQVRDLVYGTNNVVIGPTNTNALAFTNRITFSNPISFGTNAATVRTNLGLSSSDVVTFSYIYNLNDIYCSQDIYCVGLSATNIAVYGNISFVTTNASATTRTNLGLGASWLTNSASPATTNATNLVAGTLPDERLSTNVAILSNLPTWATTTNAATARTNLGLGQTDSVTFSQITVTNTFYPPTFTSTNGLYGAGSLRMTGTTTSTRLIYKLLGATPLDRTVLNAEDNLSNLSDAATARTNLSLGWLALTNTNASNFRTDIGLGSLATNNSVPSLSAATNSLLTADGSGGSSFVASRLSVAGLTTNVVRTSWANSGADKPTNDTGLSLTYTANNVYRLKWSIFVSSTWSNVAYGIAFSSTNSFGTRNGYQVTPSSSTPSGATIAAGVTNTTLVSDSTTAYTTPSYVGGELVFYATNAGTVNFRFWTTSSNTNTSTLLSNSIIQLEKMYP